MDQVNDTLTISLHSVVEITTREVWLDETERLVREIQLRSASGVTLKVCAFAEHQILPIQNKQENSR